MALWGCLTVNGHPSRDDSNHTARAFFSSPGELLPACGIFRRFWRISRRLKSARACLRALQAAR